MSSKSKKGSESGSISPVEGAAKGRLPFEPAATRKKASKKVAPSARSIDSAQEKAKPTASSSTAIPEVVSRRMARRMAYFCGIPTGLGLLTFAACYVVVSQDWLKVPNVIVVLASMGFFGLGVLGLSYGVISASWDEERIGSLHGWEEFSTNFGRLTQAWREAGEAKRKPNP
ncbi:MAG TPA: PAM68 family protein [Thermosynechococcaceae cyanobacterium]